MLLSDNAGGGGEDPERSLAQTRLGGLAGLEEDRQQLRPLIACTNAIVRTVTPTLMSSGIPLSVYWRAISATASPTFLRTSMTDSVVKHVTSFSRIATRCSLGKLRKTSLASPVAGSLRVLVAILRNNTEEKARVCCRRAYGQ